MNARKTPREYRVTTAVDDPYWPGTSAEAYKLALENLPRIPNTESSVTLTSSARAMEVFGEDTWLRYPFDEDGAKDVCISVIRGETAYIAGSRLDANVPWVVRAYHPPTRTL